MRRREGGERKGWEISVKGRSVGTRRGDLAGRLLRDGGGVWWWGGLSCVGALIRFDGRRPSEAYHGRRLVGGHWGCWVLGAGSVPSGDTGELRWAKTVS